MSLKETRMVEIWTEAARGLNGIFSMPLQKINGGNMDGGMYLFEIGFKYKTVSIKINTGIYELLRSLEAVK